MVGSGFVVEVDAHHYLTTVAHLATRQIAQMDNWSIWDNELILYSPAGEAIASYSLFEVTEEGDKLPRFKYWRLEQNPTKLVDLVMLPLEVTDPLVQQAEIFHLPNDAARPAIGYQVTMVGCRPWPSVNQQIHVLTKVDAIHHVLPQQEEGYSGCPVVDSQGRLVGMPFGGDLPAAPNRGLLVGAHIIQTTAGHIDGRPATAVAS